MDKLIIEVRINEYVSREVNPNVPWTPQEIADDAAACREAGASIVHFHARNADGSAAHDPATYADAIRRIRARTDLIIHPTLGFTTASSDEDRIAPLVQVARDPATRPELASVDMGSTNVDTYDGSQRRFLTQDRVYANSIGTLAYFNRTLKDIGVKPSLLSWTVASSSTIQAFHDMGLTDGPLFVTFIVSASYIGAHPATPQGLEAHLMFLPHSARGVHWSMLCKGTSIFPLATMAIVRGGHVSIGLGDYGYPELGAPTNAELVQRLVEIARAIGRQPATPDEAREMLGIRGD